MKKCSFSLKFKITLWYTLFMLVFSAVVLSAMTAFTKTIMERDISQRIIRTVNDTAHMTRKPFGKNIFPPDFRLYNNGVHMVIYDENGKVSEGQIPFGIEKALPGFEEGKIQKITHNGDKYYIYDSRADAGRADGSYRVRGIAALAEESYALDSATKVNIALTLVLILIASCGGYFIISRAFVPVNKISGTAKAIIESSDLSQRINPGKGTDEITALANTFDEMLEKLEKTFENEKRFTSDASHELRTPVAVIISECEYMTDCAESAEELKESAEIVKKQAEKMSRLISELLTISRMDRNAFKLTPEDTDLSELVGLVCSEQKEINRKDVIMETDIKEGISAEVDRLMITRLFINLISNAYRYNKENGSIKVSLDETPSEIVFSVSDSGIGISEENMPKIWERFYQADTARTATDSGSMGLGLSMVKGIAEAHGGTVSVKSKLGEGSTFTFTLPKK